MPTLLIRHPDGNESETELAGELTVGRAEGNDVILGEGGVSRRHARIFVDAGKVFVEDAGSANGTYVDGQKIEAPTALGPRSQLVIGDYEISLQTPGAKARPAGPKPKAGNGSPLGGGQRATVQRAAMKAVRSTRVVEGVKKGAGTSDQAALAKRAPRGADLPAASGPALRGLTGPWANKVFAIRGKVTVGRVAGVQVQIEDDSVSRRHAEVESSGGALVLRDLGSANGTLVNGAPAEGDVTLAPGDIVQFGVVELVVESASDGAGPRRRGGGATPEGAGKKKLLIGVGAIAGVGALLFAARLVVSPGPPANQVPGPAHGTDTDCGEYLSQCRSYSAPEISEPDWRRAEVACNKCVEIDPINAEANELLKKITIEKAASEHYERGDKALHRLHEDDAIDEFSKIPRESFYYAKLKTQIQDVIESGMKRAGDDCKRYSSQGYWQEAAERCGRYMFFACQNMPPTELEPPPGFAIKAPGNARKRQWWPKDPMFQHLMTALSHDPTSKPWHCEKFVILQQDKGPPKPEEAVHKSVDARFSDRVIAMSVMEYWEGKTSESVVALQKTLEDTEKAALHGQVKQLMKQIRTAAGLFTDGETELQKDDVEQAGKYFEEALQLDAEVMKEQAEIRPSFIRRNIQNDIAAKAYERGRFFTEREDPRKGCRIWKVGFKFFKGNTDLNKATAYCSTQAQRALDAAQACPDLDKAIDFAVDGDGIKEKVVDQRVQMKCAEPSK